MKHADSKGTRLVKEPDDNGRWIVIWRQRESSLSPVTSISCNHITSSHTKQEFTTRIDIIKTLSDSMKEG